MDTLFFLLEQLYHMTSIPIRCLDATGEIVLFNKGYKQEHDPFNFNSVRQTMLTSLNQKQSPFIEIDNIIYLYGCFKDTTDCVVIIGPISTITLGQDEMKKHAKKYDIPDKDFFISNSGIRELGGILSMLQFNRYGSTVKGNDLFKDVTDEKMTHDRNMYVFTNTDESITRLSYNTEKEFVEQIKTGDIDTIEQQIERQMNNRNTETLIGRLAQNPSKHFEYMVCTSLCLASRAAIDGGVAPSTAYTMSDIYLQRLENCADITDMLALYNKMRLDFAKQVNLIQKTRSDISYVEKCKIYIGQNLNKPFTLDDIAQSITINKRYLARLFVQDVGVTIMGYARNERIKAAANMLKFSDEKISAIAIYLTFPSQSHFGKVFKDITGVTPKQYRATNQTIDLNAQVKNLT